LKRIKKLLPKLIIANFGTFCSLILAKDNRTEIEERYCHPFSGPVDLR
jgi:hypothetical protein